MTTAPLNEMKRKDAGSPYFLPALFAFGFFVILAVYIWKAPLEIQGLDEVFYLTIPKRLLDGDGLLIHEWHGSQMSALLLLPFVKLHLLLFGTEGILLRFRYLYIAVLAASTVVIYVRLRSYKLFGVLASLFFFLVIPYDIMALSYDSMGVILMALTCTLLATAKGRLAYCVSGLLFAAAVLCSPYLILAYALLSLSLAVYCAVRRTVRPLRQWGLFTAGAVALAIPVLAFILSRATISQIAQALPYIFSDSEHPSRPLKLLLVSYCKAFFCISSYKLAITVINEGAVVLYLAAVVLALFDRRRALHRAGYLLAAFAVSTVVLVSFFPELPATSYNFILVPLVYVGLMSFIVAKKKNWPVFLSFFCVGLSYTFAIHLASNQYAYVISIASAVVNIGSILLFGEVCREMAEERAAAALPRRPALPRALCGAAALFFVLQFSCLGYTRVNHKFWSLTDNRLLTEVIGEGAYKGLRVTPETREEYMRDLEMIRPLKGRTGTVFIAAQQLYLYMDLPDLKIGAQSPWVTSRDEEIKRLAGYYELNPDKVPDYILVPPYSGIDPNVLKSEILDAYGFRREALPESDAVLYVR